MLAAAEHPVQPHIRPGLDRSVPLRRYTDPYLRVFDLSSGSSLQREPSGSRRHRCVGLLAPHGADEEGTHLRLKAHFGQLVYPKINTHGGRSSRILGTSCRRNSRVFSRRCGVLSDPTRHDPAWFKLHGDHLNFCALAFGFAGGGTT